MKAWSIEIGDAFRGFVVRRQTVRLPTTWIASINTTAMGDYLDRRDAMQRVEEQIESAMPLVLHDWRLSQGAKAKR